MNNAVMQSTANSAGQQTGGIGFRQRLARAAVTWEKKVERAGDRKQVERQR